MVKREKERSEREKRIKNRFFVYGRGFSFGLALSNFRRVVPEPKCLTVKQSKAKQNSADQLIPSWHRPPFSFLLCSFINEEY